MNHPSSFLASSSPSSFPSRTATILSLLQQQRQQQQQHQHHHHPARPPPSRLSSVVSYGSETLVPPHDICRLSYYLKCCAIGCGMLPLWPPTNNNNNNEEDPHALLDYERAHRLSVSQQQAIVQWALHHWKLESFLNRAILLDDGHVLLPHGTLNTFLEFQTVAECFPSLLTAMTSPSGSGSPTTRSVVKVMLCTTRWMQEYYIDPFLRYMQGDLLIETYATRVRPHRAYYEEDDEDDDDYFFDDDDDESRPETPLLWDEPGNRRQSSSSNPTATRPVPDHSTAAAPLHSLLPWLDLQDAPLQPTNAPRQGQANSNNNNDRTNNKSVLQEIVLSPNDCRAIHSGIVCQGGSNCRQRSNTTLPSDLMGPRYRCLSCQHVNLCLDCYQSACHDQTHWFECIPYEGSKPQWVPPQVVPCAAAHLLVQQGKKKRKYKACTSRDVHDMDRKPAAKRMKRQEKDHRQQHPAHADGSDSDDSCSIIPPMAVAVPLPDYVDSLLYGNEGRKASSSAASSHPHTAAATWVL